MWLFVADIVSWGKRGWKWLWGVNKRKKGDIKRWCKTWKEKEKCKKGPYRKRVMRRGQRAVGVWLWVGVCTLLGVLLVLLVKCQPSFYVKTINRKIKSGRWNFGAVEISSLIVFYLWICIKMTVKKFELSCSLLFCNLHPFPLKYWSCFSWALCKKAQTIIVVLSIRIFCLYKP